MRSKTSRFSRETFRFSWNLSSFAETFRFSKSLGFFPLLMAGHTLLYCAEISWPATWWNKCFFGFHVWLFVARETSRFSLKLFVSRKVSSISILGNGRPSLPINCRVHSSKLLTLFLRENPKIPERKNQELAGFLKPKIQKEKESSREKRKENSSLLISVPNPVTSSVEIRTGIKVLRLVRPHAPQVVRLARKTLGQESSRIR